MNPNPKECGPFWQAALKVCWASETIAQLNRVIRTFRYDTNILRSYYDSERGKYVAEIAIPAPREGFALFIGDTVHAISSALDYCWTELARRAELTGRHTFPSHETRANLEDMVKKSSVAGAYAEAIPFILETIRPYEGGNYLVWAARRLDNIDKHNLLIPITHITDAGHFACSTGEGASFRMMMAGEMNLHGSGRYELGTSDEPIVIHQNKPVVFDVCFAEGQLFDGKPVVETLSSLADAVGETVKLFAKTFPNV